MKIIITLITILLILLGPSPDCVYAESKYARIINQTPLYANAVSTDSIENIILLTEPTYFVQIILDYNDTLYKACYHDIIGYIKKSDTKAIIGVPINPYPNNILITITKACYMRSSPIVDKNKLSTLDVGTQVEFIGKVYGTEAMDMSGDTWYYVKYNNEYGYIYSEYSSQIGTILANIEQVTYLGNNDNQSVINPLSNKVCLALLSIIILPAIVILLLLYYPKVNKHRDS